MNKIIRWKQRFTNFKNAFAQLEKGLAIEKPSDIEKQGIIQSFEFTFELAWKTLKDFLEGRGVKVDFPRDIIKKAFQNELIENGDAWLDMLDKRNLLAHSYDAKRAEEAYLKIKDIYFGGIQQVRNKLEHEFDQ